MSTPLYTCKFCERTYTRYSSYYGHIKAKHKPASKKVCKGCGEFFKTNAQLYTHFYKNCMLSVPEDAQEEEHEIQQLKLEEKPKPNKPRFSLADSPWAL